MDESQSNRQSWEVTNRDILWYACHLVCFKLVHYDPKWWKLTKLHVFHHIKELTCSYKCNCWTEGQSETVSVAQSYLFCINRYISGIYLFLLKSRFKCQPDFFFLIYSLRFLFAEQVEDGLESYSSSAVIFSCVYVA